jgi:peptidoglycan/xylan/chitin deacetylase (PgdA/CDA1 family)
MIKQLSGPFWRMQKKVGRRFSCRAAILLYHRVARIQHDPWSLCVTPENFEDHLAVLHRHARPISLNQFVQELETNSLHPGSVAISFDDGYADNLQAALPALQRFDIPATFFITSGAVDNPLEFWWDELGRYVLDDDYVPGLLRVELSDGTHEIDLGPVGPVAKGVEAKWQARNPAPGPREAAYLYLWRLLQPLGHRERTNVLDLMARRAGVLRDARGTHRTLTMAELSMLASHPLTEIGAHTVTHPVLAALSTEAQHAEIAESRSYLEELVGKPINCFAYPHGDTNDYTPETLKVIGDLGFRYACSTLRHPIRYSSDRRQLPRIYMQDMDGARFSKLIREWLGVRVT